MIPKTSCALFVAMATGQARLSERQLHKAAGSKIFNVFLESVTGWTSSEIDDISISGKNPVHMAAWKGNLENLKYLVEELECNVNEISTGEFSYGKTPIFFGLTQNRHDVVEYLLEKGAHVKIVNNKGQTPLSIASSHLRDTTIAKIQQQERHQDSLDWINYRVTHSDGLRYGDLDPRFLDRPLLSSDNLTDLAINPTTKQIRKGNFRRNNPNQAEKGEPKIPIQQQAQARRGTFQPPQLSNEEKSQLEFAWHALEEGIRTEKASEQSLLPIVELNNSQQRPWISEASARLRQIGDTHPMQLAAFVRLVTPSKNTLVQRLVSRVQTDDSGSALQEQRSSNKKKARSPQEHISDTKWKTACDVVKDLSISALETTSTLSLPCSPVFVNTVDGLDTLKEAVQSTKLVSFDSEWHVDDIISTLQLSLGNSSTTWVVDLLEPEPLFQQKCRAFCASLLRNKLLLGFAISHDVAMLLQYVDDRTLCVSEDDARLLDLQRLWTSQSERPGLKTCTSEFSSVPLSKQEQCSNWSARPLTPAQLEYAGLDAALLPYLLSEVRKRAMLHMDAE